MRWACFLAFFVLPACRTDSPQSTPPLDITKPTVSITFPPNNSTVSDSVAITTSAIDDVRVVKVEFEIDGTLANVSLAAPWLFVWDVRPLGNLSTHSILARAYDAANNVGQSHLVTVLVSHITAADTILVANSSFEIDATPSLIGWFHNYAEDSTSAMFSTSVPPGGGHYSVGLINRWSFHGAISTRLRALAGTHRYRLTAWSKKRSDPLAYGGSMSLSLCRRDSLLHFSHYRFHDTVWVQGSLLDTLTATSGDSIYIQLQGDPSQHASGFTLFDLCQLTRLD